MKFLHDELKRARKKAGLSQQALAERVGIPRNQIVRAEQGENITIDTLRKIAAHLPVTELTLIDTTELRVDIIPEPEKLLFAALENLLGLTAVLRGAILLTLEARNAVDIARRTPSLVPGFDPSILPDPLRSLRDLELILERIEEIGAKAKASPPFSDGEEESEETAEESPESAEE